MKAVVIVLSLVAFIACLLIGVQVGNGSLQIPDAAQSPASPTPTSDTRQRTVLWITADDLQSKSARLTGLSIIFYRPDTPHIMVMSLYPSADHDASTDALAKSFSLDDAKTPSSTFFEKVKSYHFNWDGYVLLDTTTNAELVDVLGGISIGEKQLDGKAAVKTLKMPWDNPKASLRSQKAFGAALCTRFLDQSTPSVNWKELFNKLSPLHAHVEVNEDQLNQDWGVLLKSNPHSSLSCEFSNPQ
jgi:hypothetical protein